MNTSRDELIRSLKSLRIPEKRRAEVQAEILDHFDSAYERAVAEGATPEVAASAALESIGDPEHLARALEQTNAGFGLGPPDGRRAAALAALAGAPIYLGLDRLLPLAQGSVADLLREGLLATALLPALWLALPAGSVACLRAFFRRVGHRARSAPADGFATSFLLVLGATPLALTAWVGADVLIPFAYVELGLLCWGLWHLALARTGRDRAVLEA